MTKSVDKSESRQAPSTVGSKIPSHLRGDWITIHTQTKCGNEMVPVVFNVLQFPEALLTPRPSEPLPQAQ